MQIVKYSFFGESWRFYNHNYFLINKLPPKIINLVWAVWSHDPESYTGRSFGFWQVLPSQAGQRVGSRQIDDQIAGSRARVVSHADTTWCILAVSYCCSAIVLRPSTIKSSTEINFRRDSTHEWVCVCVSVINKLGLV